MSRAGCEYFSVEEVFHPSFIAVHGKDCWFLRPQEIWDNLDNLRKAWGKPILINAKGLHYCGVRPKDSPVGAKRSRHKPIYSNVQAFDLHGRTTNETHDLYLWLIADGWKAGSVERVEDWAHTPGWVHAEISSEAVYKLRVFNP